MRGSHVEEVTGQQRWLEEEKEEEDEEKEMKEMEAR